MPTLRALVPVPVKSRLRQLHRRSTLRRALREFRELRDGAPLPRPIADRLFYGWGNEGWSASQDFLTGVVAAAWQTAGPIVECGSGLSTLLLDHIAARQGRQVFSLEHDATWAATMEGRTGPHVRVIAAPLTSYGEFDWYARATLPQNIGLVICDGPPSTTRGGRYGLLPILRDKLAPNCRILLDDCIRQDEQQTILERWARMTGGLATISPDARPYGTLIVP